jgi:hypothetical protein
MDGHQSLKSAVVGGRPDERSGRFLARQIRSIAEILLRGLSVACLLTMWSGSAEALIVGNVPDIVPATTVNPQDYPGWVQGDPGWDNVSAAGSNYVYLGDGWVLSARHVGYNSTTGVQLQTVLPGGEPGPVQSFYRIPGSYYFDYGYGQTNPIYRQYAVSNPTTILSETGGTISLADSQGTYFTDLQLFRISADPGLPALTIASEHMPANFIRSNAPEVVFIGRGRGRLAAETHWDVTGTSPDLTWTVTTDTGDYQGYTCVSSSTKHFGTNRLTDIRPNYGGDPSDPGATNYTQNPNKWYEASDVISDTTGAIALQTPDGVTRDIISMATVYDRQTGVGATELETQAVSGNSGSSMFYNRGTAEAPQWELAGIVHANVVYEDQPAYTGVYGNGVIVSDLSYYNQDYLNSIKYIIDSHPDYSYVGDVNLDGIVSGNGTGAWATDDVTAFIAGWGYDSDLEVGTITSWKSGDLDLDGKTDVADFLLMRGVLNPSGAGALAAMLGLGGISSVPEPASAVLVLIGAVFLSIFRRKARR